MLKLFTNELCSTDKFIEYQHPLFPSLEGENNAGRPLLLNCRHNDNPCVINLLYSAILMHNPGSTVQREFQYGAEATIWYTSYIGGGTSRA